MLEFVVDGVGEMELGEGGGGGGGGGGVGEDRSDVVNFDLDLNGGWVFIVYPLTVVATTSRNN